MQSIFLAGGCFWCTEAVFLNVKGVKKVTPGYIGGNTKNPNYEDICTGTSGHAEAIKCDFDETKISLELIFKIFFITHDPTQKNRQGNDVGTQYRSAIFYKNLAEKEMAQKAIKNAQILWNNKIQTKLSNKLNFTTAENYHHNYFEKNPNSMYCSTLIPPKLRKLKESYPGLFKR